MRILIVDDHVLLSETLARKLSEEPDVDEVLIASNGNEAIDLATGAQVDIVVMDIDMPGLLCWAAVRAIRDNTPATQFIFLTAFVHDTNISQALEVGASGFVSKTETTDAVLEAIRDVHNGRSYFSKDVLARVVIDGDGVKLADETQSKLQTLSHREMAVLTYMARGFSNKMIASSLHISTKTVESHCTHISNKLGIHGRVELARFAFRERLVEV